MSTRPSKKLMSFLATAALAVTAGVAVPAGVGAAITPISPDDYASSANWVCRPDLAPADNPCEGAVTTTRVDNVWPFQTTKNVTPTRVASSQRPVDCFAVYPTVASQQYETVAQDVKDRDIRDTVRWQVAPFSSRCRMFVPGYRQTPVGANRAGAQAAYADVQAAWDHYMATENNGRGVILIGHSQGSLMLRELIKNRIDLDPTARGRLVGAFLLGANVMVKPGTSTGGDFRNVPVCTTKGQYGCIVTYSTYDTDPWFEIWGKATQDGLNNSGEYVFDWKSKAFLGIFATPFFDDLAKGSGYQVACTDPGRLSGMTGTFGIRTPYEGNLAVAKRSTQWNLLGITQGVIPPAVATAWVDAFDYTGSCRTINGYNVFRYAPANWWSPAPFAMPLMGTHTLDMNLGMDRLLRIAELQTTGWRAVHS